MIVGSSVAVADAEHVAGLFAVDCSVVVIVGSFEAVADAEHVAGLSAVDVDSAAHLRRCLLHLSTIVFLGPLEYLYGFVARLIVGLFVVMEYINH